jgi:hypothetical protein
MFLIIDNEVGSVAFKVARPFVGRATRTKQRNVTRVIELNNQEGALEIGAQGCCVLTNFQHHISFLNGFVNPLFSHPLQPSHDIFMHVLIEGHDSKVFIKLQSILQLMEIFSM